MNLQMTYYCKSVIRRVLSSQLSQDCLAKEIDQGQSHYPSRQMRLCY